MYTKKTYYLKYITQVEKGFTPRLGNHNSHQKRINPTPEQMKAYNQNQATQKTQSEIMCQL